MCLRLHGIEGDGSYYSDETEESIDYDHQEEMMPHDADVKVKIMKVGSGDDVHSMMNQILGG